MNWKTYLPHAVQRGKFTIIQIAGGRRWSLAVFIKPKGNK